MSLNFPEAIYFCLSREEETHYAQLGSNNNKSQGGFADNKTGFCVSWLQKFEYIVKQYSLLSHCLHFSSSTTEILRLNVTNTFLLLCQFLSVKMSPFNAFQ